MSAPAAPVLPNLTGKTILITGATSGIGLEASVALARAGARVVMVGRDPKKTEAAVLDVKKRAGVNNVESLLGDFFSQAAVRKIAAEYRARFQRLDVLVNNAGLVYAQRTLTTEGLEGTFAVNHLGPFLLTNLLLDLIIASAPARIVNVASTAHEKGTIDFDDLNYERTSYGLMRAYARSKLANVLFTRKLAKDLADKKVTVNALHPGVVASNIWQGGWSWGRPFIPLIKLFMISPEKGSRTITYAAASPELEGKTGLYLEKNVPKAPAKLGRDDALANRLWAESAKLVKLG